MARRVALTVFSTVSFERGAASHNTKIKGGTSEISRWNPTVAFIVERGGRSRKYGSSGAVAGVGYTCGCVHTLASSVQAVYRRPNHARSYLIKCR